MHVGHLGWGWGRVEVNNVYVNLDMHGLYGMQMGVGLGSGEGTNVKNNVNTCHANLWDPLLHFDTYVMLHILVALVLQLSSRFPGRPHPKH